MTVTKIDFLVVKETLADVLERVEHGEEVVVMRDGRAVARIVAERSDEDIARARKAVEELREMRKGVTLGGISIKELIEEGRE
jgi:antitoxin (DNA-binding transcriptional repressor) of toxin-antitoxin stability system